LPQEGVGGYHNKDAVPGAIWQEETLNCSSLYCRKQALEVIMTNKDAVPGAIWQEETLNWSFLFFLEPSGDSKH
jgi:hypothetical protein